MSNGKAAPKQPPGPRKSTLLLVLVILCLLNATLFLRASVNSFFTATDTGAEYTPVIATVTALEQEKDSPGAKGQGMLVPVLNFNYRGQLLTRPAPGLHFRHEQVPAGGPGQLQVGDRIQVLVHDYTGEIVMPQARRRRAQGVSQAFVSGLSLVLAWGLCRLRTWLWRKNEHRAPPPHSG
ncbi:MAG TPA: hypothetical protein ENI89_01155 [Desulfobulbus sp.]|nr:hypothetical protein [Desulfobulbus sp.]